MSNERGKLQKYEDVQKFPVKKDDKKNISCV